MMQMIPETRLRRSTDVDIPTCGAGAPQILGNWSLHSLGIKLLGLLVEWSALLDNCEALDLQFLAGLLDCCNPRRLLAQKALLLADDLARLGLDKVCLLQSSCGLVNLAKKRMTLGKLGRDGLLLHGLHCLHGRHGFHRLHCFCHL